MGPYRHSIEGMRQGTLLWAKLSSLCLLAELGSEGCWPPPKPAMVLLDCPTSPNLCCLWLYFERLGLRNSLWWCVLAASVVGKLGGNPGINMESFPGINNWDTVWALVTGLRGQTCWRYWVKYGKLGLVIIVPADDLAPLSARASAGIVMIKLLNFSNFSDRAQVTAVSEVLNKICVGRIE